VLSLPSIIASPIAGVLADSFNRRTLLTIINFFRLVLTLLVLVTFNLPGLLIILAFFLTMATQFFMPTEQASVPEVVPADKLLQANSFFTFSLYSSFLVGFAGAGPLLEYGGTKSALLVIAGLFLVAAILNKALPSLAGHIKGDKKTVLEKLQLSHIWQCLIEGIHYIKDQKILLTIILQVAFIFAVERAIIALVPAFAQDLLGFSIAEISFFMITPLAIGTVLGVILINKLKYKYPQNKLILMGLIIDAIVLLLLPLYPEFDRLANLLFYFNLGDGVALVSYIAILSLASGLADVIIIVSAQTFIQQNVKTEIRGRVFASLMLMMNLLGIPLVLLISGLADIINITVTMVSFGLATLLVSVWGWWAYNKSKTQKTALNDAIDTC
jgi:MFS transporter, DHA3 family, macrolide efflux protein